jgi:hypothetical protein
MNANLNSRVDLDIDVIVAVEMLMFKNPVYINLIFRKKELLFMHSSYESLE